MSIFKSKASIFLLVVIIIPAILQYGIQVQEGRYTETKMTELHEAGYYFCINYPKRLVTNLPEMEKYQVIFWFQAEKCSNEIIERPRCNETNVLATPTAIPRTIVPPSQSSAKLQSFLYDQKCHNIPLQQASAITHNHNYLHNETYTVTLTIEDYIILHTGNESLQPQHLFTTTNPLNYIQILSVSALPLKKRLDNQTWLEYTIETSLDAPRQRSIQSDLVVQRFRGFRHWLSTYISLGSWLFACVVPLFIMWFEWRQKDERDKFEQRQKDERDKQDIIMRLRNLIEALKEISTSSRRSSPEEIISEYVKVRSIIEDKYGNDIRLQKELNDLEERLRNESLILREFFRLLDK